MKIPDDWFVTDTGGGCTALVKDATGRNPSAHHWYITQEGDPSAPDDPAAKCTLGYYLDENVHLQWECSCLAEALSIADGAKTLQ